MTTLEKNLLRGLALLTLALVVAGPSHAQGARSRSRAPVAASSPTFAYAGSYSGTIGNQVTIGDYAFWISPQAQVYQIGSGLVPLGQLPIGTTIFATGTDRGGVRTVMLMIARPADESPPSTSDGAANIKELDPKLPQ